MKIIYSFNKRGFEEDYWAREIAAASTTDCQYIPFNHGPYLEPALYIRAQLLDNLYYQQDRRLLQMYADVQDRVRTSRADALLVDNCFPYHPEFLRRLPIYKVLRTSDGPMATYDRDFAYVHAYDHVLYHSPAYSCDMEMQEKLRYCGVKKADFWPLGSFQALCDTSKNEQDILSSKRDIDIIFIGSLYMNKLPVIGAIKQAFGRRFVLRSQATLKKRIYLLLRYGFHGWVTRAPFRQFVPLYQRAKIGVNVHNRGKYTVGSYRMFDLPANGVFQISDGGEFLQRFYAVGEEVVSYESANDLISKLEYYLSHDSERARIALNGFRRVQRDYRIGDLLRKAGDLIQKGMQEAASA